MSRAFDEALASLKPSLERLVSAPMYVPLNVPREMPKCGIYLLSEQGTPLYVGRSNRLRKRLSNHCRRSATYKMAAFAFRIARESTGNVNATYRPEGSRSALMADPEFAAAFEAAKERIRAMNVRFVEEVDPIRQTLLEVYAALSLATPYNDFDTH